MKSNSSALHESTNVEAHGVRLNVETHGVRLNVEAHGVRLKSHPLWRMRNVLN